MKYRRFENDEWRIEFHRNGSISLHGVRRHLYPTKDDLMSLHRLLNKMVDDLNEIAMLDEIADEELKRKWRGVSL